MSLYGLTYRIISNSQSWLGFATLSGVLYANNGVSFGVVDPSTGTFTVKSSAFDNNLRFMAVAGSRIAIASASSTGRIFSTSTTDGSHYTSTDATDYLGVASDGTDIYATSENSRYIYKLSGLLGTSTRTLLDTGSANTHRGLAFLNGKLYLGAADGLYEVNTSTGAKTRVFSSGALGQLAADSRYIYAASPGNGVYRFDVTASRDGVELIYSMTETIFALAYMSTTNKLYVGIYGGNIVELSLPAVQTAPQSTVATSTIYRDTVVTLYGGTYGDPANAPYGTYMIMKYTTDGTTPSETNGILYTGAITITKTTTLKVCSIYSNWVVQSEFTYTYKVSTPQSSLPSDTYDGRQTVTLSTTSENASIYYTLDGSTPSASSTLYTGAFYIDATLTLNAIAIKSGCTSSDIVSYNYASGSGLYYFLPNSLNYGPSSIFTGLAVDSYGNLFVSGSGSDGSICKVDTIDGTPTYWGYTNPKAKLNCNSAKLYVASYNSYLSYYNLVGTSATKGSSVSQYNTAKNWVGSVVSSSTLYAFADGHLYSGFTSAGNTITQITTVAKTTVTGITAHNSAIYVCATDGIYFLNKSTGAYTKLASSVARAWTGITSDGTNLYGCVNGGYIYKINVSTGADSVITGDSTTRAWSNIVYYDGILYATTSVGGGIYKITLQSNVLYRQVYSGGTWKTAKDWWVYSSASWKPILKMYKNVSGSWVKIL